MNTPQDPTYAKILCNRISTFYPSIIILILLFGQIGFFSGFCESISVVLQTRGISYTQQSLLSVVGYPQFLKIIFAPVLDQHYIYKLGKCKTYILICGFVNVFILLILSTQIEEQIKNLEIGKMVILLLIASFMNAFEMVAMDAWILTLQSSEDRVWGAYSSQIGQLTGVFISFNIYIVLNSKKWLNEHIFSVNNPIDEPLITDSGFQLFVSLYTAIVTACVTMFYSEKHIKVKLDSYTQIAKLSVKVFSRPKTWLQVKWTLVQYVFFSMFNKPMEQQMIDHKFERESLATIGSMVMIPKILVLLVFSKCFIIKGKQNWYTYILSIYFVICALLNYGIYQDLAINANLTRTYWLLLALELIGIFEGWRFTLGLGFYALICDDTFGGTHFTLLACVRNIITHLSESSGLFLTDYINFNVLICVGLVVQVILLILTRKDPVVLDESDVEEFRPIHDVEEFRPIHDVENNEGVELLPQDKQRSALI